MVKLNETEELYAVWLTGFMDGKRNEPREPPQADDARMVYELAYKLGVRIRIGKITVDSNRETD